MQIGPQNADNSIVDWEKNEAKFTLVLSKGIPPGYGGHITHNL